MKNAIPHYGNIPAGYEYMRNISFTDIWAIVNADSFFMVLNVLNS